MLLLFLQLFVVVVPFFHVLVVELHVRLFFHRLLCFGSLRFFYRLHTDDWPYLPFHNRQKNDFQPFALFSQQTHTFNRSIINIPTTNTTNIINLIAI